MKALNNTEQAISDFENQIAEMLMELIEGEIKKGEVETSPDKLKAD